MVGYGGVIEAYHLLRLLFISTAYAFTDATPAPGRRHVYLCRAQAAFRLTELKQQHLPPHAAGHMLIAHARRRFSAFSGIFAQSRTGLLISTMRIHASGLRQLRSAADEHATAKSRLSTITHTMTARRASGAMATGGVYGDAGA